MKKIKDDIVEKTGEEKLHYGFVNFERRRYPRFTIDLPIEYFHESSEVRLSGRALNASEGGLLIYLSEKVELGDTLRLRLYFTSGQSLDRVETLVRVVWIDLHLGEKGEDYRCGVKFVDISSTDVVKLKTFLKDLSE